MNLTEPDTLRRLPFIARQFRWRLPQEVSQALAKVTYKPLSGCINPLALKFHLTTRGGELADTAVTSGQRDLLLAAVGATEPIELPLVELGSWKGATTAALAAATSRTIFAVDPYSDYAGADADIEIMRGRTRAFSHVKHIRERSAGAATILNKQRLSLVFVDAIHDYMNTWFDFRIWGELVVPGGIVVLHDCDDHVGTNLACRRILRQKNYVVWGYCPNIIAFRKESE